MNLKLLNVKYSPNVGDGLLVDCLEAHLRNADGMRATSSVDLAGRTDHGLAAHHREKMMWVLESVPAVIRPHMARAGLSAKLALGLRGHYRRELAGAEAVVVGGGNLLSDQDLNFPMKIVAALGEVVRLDARVAIYGCGVAADWSRTGKKMLCAALASNRPVVVAVRDEASKTVWDRLFASAAGAEASIVRDPGILASTVYKFDSTFHALPRPNVAIGVMSSLAIRYHGFDSLSADKLTEWYSGLVDEMLELGFNVSLFTNGSPEDQRFADGLWHALSTHPLLARIQLAVVRIPLDLCRVIFMADVVVAFRMHALIAAYSYGKPIVALKWDAKVDAFLKSVDLEDAIADANTSSPNAVALLLLKMWERGVDQKKLDTVLAETERDVNSLAVSLQTP